MVINESITISTKPESIWAYWIDVSSSFEFIHTAGALKGSIAFFAVEPEENGSLVRVLMRLAGPVIMRMMMFFMGGIMRKGVRGDLQKLKELLEKPEFEA